MAKPYHVFLLLWLIATSLAYFHFSNETQTAQDTIHNAKRVSGKVVKANYLIRTKDYRVEVNVPPTFGITQCSGSISSDEYAATPSRGRVVDMYVIPDRNAVLRCWAASELDKRASRPMANQLTLSGGLGLGFACFLYLLVVRIPFGTPRKSLKNRWFEEIP